MQTYPISCILKKDWISHRGRLYPAGATFKREENPARFPNRADGPGHWFKFKIPTNVPFPHVAGSFGFVFIPDKVFFRLTEEEIILREARKKLRDVHMKSYESI